MAEQNQDGRRGQLEAKGKLAALLPGDNWRLKVSFQKTCWWIPKICLEKWPMNLDPGSCQIIDPRVPFCRQIHLDPSLELDSPLLFAERSTGLQYALLTFLRDLLGL